MDIVVETLSKQPGFLGYQEVAGGTGCWLLEDPETHRTVTVEVNWE